MLMRQERPKSDTLAVKPRASPCAEVSSTLEPVRSPCRMLWPWRWAKALAISRAVASTAPISSMCCCCCCPAPLAACPPLSASLTAVAGVGSAARNQPLLTASTTQPRLQNSSTSQVSSSGVLLLLPSSNELGPVALPAPAAQLPDGSTGSCSGRVTYRYVRTMCGCTIC